MSSTHYSYQYNDIKMIHNIMYDICNTYYISYYVSCMYTVYTLCCLQVKKKQHNNKPYDSYSS